MPFVSFCPVSGSAATHIGGHGMGVSSPSVGGGWPMESREVVNVVESCPAEGYAPGTCVVKVLKCVCCSPFSTHTITHRYSRLGVDGTNP